MIYTNKIYFDNILLIYIFVINNAEIMKTISLKIDDSIFIETEKILARIKKPRNRYINEALDHYNRLQKRMILENKLRKESEIVREDSMDMLRDFEDIDYVD
jgi:hypothetical protein